MLVKVGQRAVKSEIGVAKLNLAVVDLQTLVGIVQVDGRDVYLFAEILHCEYGIAQVKVEIRIPLQKDVFFGFVIIGIGIERQRLCCEKHLIAHGENQRIATINRSV